MGKEPKPKRLDVRTRLLQQLYATVGQVIALEAAGKSKGVLLDGDLEVPYADDVKQEIQERIAVKMARIARFVQELQRDSDGKA